MSGGGVTPFSPTPWIFNTGDSPRSMGQNCIAGTTEFDEENGIGLVMYVESGNNMIVWKMSDGTKQGTTVPVSSDYQNMLRTAFENKTGITIGYFIFHPYTEETIDIGSSITINSGDTPQQTLFKWGIMGQTSNLLAGELRRRNETSLDVYVYQAPSDSTKMAIITSGGMVSINAQGRNQTVEQTMLDNIATKMGEQIDQLVLIPCPANVGETLPDWENYIDCTQ